MVRDTGVVGTVPVGIVEEGFIDGIYFHLGTEPVINRDDTGADVRVKRVVGAEYRHILLRTLGGNLEPGIPAAESRFLRRRVERDDDTVIIGKDDDGLPGEIGPEKAFAGSVKTVCVNMENHNFRTTPVTVPKSSVSSVTGDKFPVPSEKTNRSPSRTSSRQTNSSS
ncbi:MAG: hypothetical protein BWY20_01068 [Spirochaetes bacterium ADurb.Bin215]|nr:MAG: hypothetical protein BWY20_01068 [Spirochaetes bacterium ADurb.Bin215]